MEMATKSSIGGNKQVKTKAARAKAAREAVKAVRAKQSQKTRAKKTQLYKSRFIPVYSKLPNGGTPGKTNLSRFDKKIGVYVIREKVKRTGKTSIVYVGASYPRPNKFGRLSKGGDLYKTIIRHFQKWSDPDPEVETGGLTFADKLKTRTYSVQVTICKSGKDAKALEKMLIQKYKSAKSGQGLNLKNKVTYKEFTATAAENDVLEFWEESEAQNFEDLDDPPF
jgi:hypothetical protein